MMKSGAESSFINTDEFKKAAVYAHKEYLSTPYSCPNKGRKDPEDERAICLLEDGRVVKCPGYFGKSEFTDEKGKIDIEKLEKYYGKKILKIIYRPNHDLLHSLRQAALVEPINQYFEKNTPGKYKLDPKNLQRLQLMMIFSVTGRKDETGFHDGEKGRELYLTYRAASAKAFLEYAKTSGFYKGEDDPELYQDALIVELMGNKAVPGREKAQHCEIWQLMQAKEKAEKDKGSDKEYPYPNTSMNQAYLEVMNFAHGLDLLRVYPPSYADDPANNEQNIAAFLSKTLNYLDKNNMLTADNIRSSIKDLISLMQYTRKLLDASGDKTTTLVEFDNDTIKTILNDPDLEDIISDIVSKKVPILGEEQNPLVPSFAPLMIASHLVVNGFLKHGSYQYDRKRFNYCHYTQSSNKDEHRHFEAEVLSGIKMLNSVARPELYKKKTPTWVTEPPVSENKINKTEIDEVIQFLISNALNTSVTGEITLEPRLESYDPLTKTAKGDLKSVMLKFDDKDDWINFIQKNNAFGKLLFGETPKPPIKYYVDINMKIIKDIHELKENKAKQTQVSPVENVVKPPAISEGVELKNKNLNETEKAEINDVIQLLINSSSIKSESIKKEFRFQDYDVVNKIGIGPLNSVMLKFENINDRSDFIKKNANHSSVFNLGKGPGKFGKFYVEIEKKDIYKIRENVAVTSNEKQTQVSAPPPPSDIPPAPSDIPPPPPPSDMPPPPPPSDIPPPPLSAIPPPPSEPPPPLPLENLGATKSQMPAPLLSKLPLFKKAPKINEEELDHLRKSVVIDALLNKNEKLKEIYEQKRVVPQSQRLKRLIFSNPRKERSTQIDQIKELSKKILDFDKILMLDLSQDSNLFLQKEAKPKLNLSPDEKAACALVMFKYFEKHAKESTFKKSALKKICHDEIKEIEKHFPDLKLTTHQSVIEKVLEPIHVDKLIFKHEKTKLK